jgi:hypothetical protein
MRRGDVLGFAGVPAFARRAATVTGTIEPRLKLSCAEFGVPLPGPFADSGAGSIPGTPPGACSARRSALRVAAVHDRRRQSRHVGVGPTAQSAP